MELQGVAVMFVKCHMSLTALRQIGGDRAGWRGRRHCPANIGLLGRKGKDSVPHDAFGILRQIGRRRELNTRPCVHRTLFFVG